MIVVFESDLFLLQQKNNISLITKIIKATGIITGTPKMSEEKNRI